MKLQPPKGMTDGAATIWRDIMKQSNDTITKADVPALTILANTYCLYKHAQTQIEKLGPVVEGTTGTPIKNPYLTVQKECWDRLKMLLVQFGLTPDARAKMKPKADVDPGPLTY